MSILSPDRGATASTWARTLRYAQGQFELVNDRMTKLLEWGSKDGESWYHAGPRSSGCS